MLPSGSQDRRPCHTGCAICLLVPLFRGPPACARSRPLVRPSPIGPRSLRLVLALALRTVAGHSFWRSRIHLPASLCSTPVTALPSSYEGSDFHRSVQRKTVDLPDSPHLNFSVVLSPTTRCPSMSASLRSFSSRSGLFPGWTVSRSASFRALGFATHSQARQDIKPNRVPHVRTDRLASGCSPPHLRGPQLIIPFGDAVTFGFQPVERLVERDLTSYSDALSGARVRQRELPLCLRRRQPPPRQLALPQSRARAGARALQSGGYATALLNAVS